jgi:hypothetical protein
MSYFDGIEFGNDIISPYNQIPVQYKMYRGQLYGYGEKPPEHPYNNQLTTTARSIAAELPEIKKKEHIQSPAPQPQAAPPAAQNDIVKVIKETFNNPGNDMQLLLIILLVICIVLQIKTMNVLNNRDMLTALLFSQQMRHSGH